MCAQSRLHKIEVIKDDDEDWLQRYLANHPELLPMHDLEGHQTELRLIGREILDIDLLFVDRKGLLTLVETKLYKNPELRRQVIAQIIDYASRVRDWSIVELCRMIASKKDSSIVEKIPDLKGFVELLGKHDTQTEGKTLQAILAHHVVQNRRDENLATSKKEADFLRRLDTMLKEESFRLAIVTDQCRPELIDLVNFASSTQRRGIQWAIVELSIETVGEYRYFVPHLVGTQNRLSPEYYREEVSERTYEKWTKERFLSELSPKINDDVTNILKQIDQRKEYLSYSFGAGITGGLILRANIKNRKNIGIVEIMVDGKVKIYSSIWGDKALNEKISKLNWRDYIKDINEDKLQEIREKVNNAKEPNTELMAFGAEGERARNIIKLLEDFHNVANQ